MLPCKLRIFAIRRPGPSHERRSPWARARACQLPLSRRKRMTRRKGVLPGSTYAYVIGAAARKDGRGKDVTSDWHALRIEFDRLVRERCDVLTSDPPSVTRMCVDVDIERIAGQAQSATAFLPPNRRRVGSLRPAAWTRLATSSGTQPTLWVAALKTGRRGSGTCSGFDGRYPRRTCPKRKRGDPLQDGKGGVHPVLREA